MISMGLCKKDIANALNYVFLTPSHPYKECHLWTTTPPPPPPPPPHPPPPPPPTHPHPPPHPPHPPTPTHPPTPPTPLLFPSMQWNQYDNALNFFFYFINGQCTEHITSHYIVLRHTESTILGLSNSWYTTTSTISNTYIDYWSQAYAVQSLNVVLSICHWYCLALVCRVLIISRWWGWTNIQLLKCNIFVSV